eukprot:352068-Chlamydomonas_euryale.AAC.1
MSYGVCPREPPEVAYLSNPDVSISRTRGGRSIQVATGDSRTANCAAAVRQTAELLAAYKATKVDDGIEVPGPTNPPPSTGDCVDQHSRCGSFKEEGYCTDETDWVFGDDEIPIRDVLCPKTCG